MKSKQNNIKDVDEDLTILFKVVDKLEKRIATLEKVLASHAKCIGQLREEKKMIFNLLLYMGIFFIVGGFSLFLYSEMKLREIDIQLFELEQKIKEEQKK